MSETDKALTVQTIASISEVSKSDWDQFIGASKTGTNEVYNPFVSHDFLSSLEESGSVSRETGWLPQHLVLSNSEGDILGALPSYVKSHSQGEYVFDHAWADAWERAGGRYYPKLQCSVPFTPATGPRLLVREKANKTSVRLGLASALCQIVDHLHILLLCQKMKPNF